ncbi:ephrin-B2 isoform X1 [Prionailurus viverrinus]|uniref:ephrin-B2 isoform X1 n=1 Tax=Prionailurus viverrinus TaxID=61388 RepID=UPI001FF4242B|nr:ephrin-B2 isoform X1 [Prionailurus viverrinus]
MAARRDSVWKYCWGVLMVLCRTAISRSIVLEPIYWNSSNSKFLPGQGLVLYPQIGDKLDIICPKVDSKTVGQYEYYKVYMVDKEQADRCTIKKENTPLLNCARPDQDVKFTIKFQEFSPNLWGLEFQKNRDYYIISTSNGSLEGLDNQEGGVCQTRAMKILMKVGQDASSAGSTRHNDPTRRPELEAGTNGRSSTTSPFVKPNPGSSTDGSSAGHSGNNILGSEVALFAGIASGCIIFIVIIITLVVLLLKYRRRHRKHSPQHTATLSLSTLATPKRSGNNSGSEICIIYIYNIYYIYLYHSSVEGCHGDQPQYICNSFHHPTLSFTCIRTRFSCKPSTITFRMGERGKKGKHGK